MNFGILTLFELSFGFNVISMSYFFKNIISIYEFWCTNIPINVIFGQIGILEY